MVKTAHRQPRNVPITQPPAYAGKALQIKRALDLLGVDIFG